MERTRFKSDSNQGTPQTLGQKARHSIKEKQKQEPVILRKITEERERAPELNDRLIFRLNDSRIKNYCDSFLTENRPTIRQERPKKLIELSIILANFLENRLLRISRDNNANKLKRYSHLTSTYLKTIDAMVHNGFLELDIKGYHFSTKGRKSRYKRTPKLLAWFEGLPELSSYIEFQPYKELVQLKAKSGKPKILIDYKENNKTRNIRKILTLVNEVNNKATITHNGMLVTAHIHAVFIKNFSNYGRLHTSGAKHAQSFKRNERPEFLINGEPVVELDYSGLHPNLLYAKEGIQYKGDPYTVVDEREEVRPFLKTILFRMINAKTIDKARASANRWLKGRKNDKAEKKVIKDIIKELGIKDSLPFIEKFKTEHKPIAKYFGKNMGIKIMNKDSQIALEVIHWFAKKGIQIIPVHDSFVVPAIHEIELQRVMKRVYRKHTSFDIGIKKNI